MPPSFLNKQLITSFVSSIIFFFSLPIHSVTFFTCEKIFPKNLQVPTLAYCNQNIVSPNQTLIAKKPALENPIILQNIIKNNNMGALYVNFNANNAKVIYRSAQLGAAPLCINELISKRKVNTLINLYGGNIAWANELSTLEQRIFSSLGGKNYFYFYDYMVNHPNQSANEINNKIATIIDVIKNSNGNVLIHCDSGENDTGVIFGVLLKCFNKLPQNDILKNLSCHHPENSKYAQQTEKNIFSIVEKFPCKLLYKQ